MIFYKTDQEIEIIRKNNLLVSRTLAEIGKMIKPGVTTNMLNKRADEYVRDHGAKPAFFGYKGFPKSICTSVNEQVVHGIPSDYALKEGDIVSVDCGTIMEGFYGDSAYTFAVGTLSQELMKLLETTKECLLLSVKQAIEGNRIGDIGHAVQHHAESNGFSVVRELVGHGLGRKMHEAPEVPNYGKRGKGIKMKKGLVICIEPMINLGTKNVKQENDGWTITTMDKKPSAHYEFAVAINKGKADILTTFDYIEKETITK